MSTDLIEAVKKAGIVGAGGAGFPTHIKLTADKIDAYIVNGAECEPLLTVDQNLMEYYPDKLIYGLQLAMKATKSKGIIALKKKYEIAAKELKKVLGKNKIKNITLAYLENVYPAGDEHVLIYDVLKRVVPEGGLPLQVGVVVNNVSTLINVYEAIQNGTPVTTRPLTVMGAVNNPQTIEVPIGTSIDYIINEIGGASVLDYKIITGGPMMGNLVSPTTPVTKTTAGILVLPSDHYLIRMKTQTPSSKVMITKAACIQCNLCTEVCPRFLLGHKLFPDKIMRAVAYGNHEKPGNLLSSFLCVDCGVCTHYGCPMGLDPCKMMGQVSNELIELGIENPYTKDSRSPKIHQDREFRKIPISRLMSRLNLSEYDHPAPLIGKFKPPHMVSISLKQHIGSPAKSLVKKGDKVSIGDLIGEIPSKASLGANVHASIDGIVERVTNELVIIKQTG